MFANLTSLLWARLSRGRGKVVFAAWLMALQLGLVASVALLPTELRRGSLIKAALGASAGAG